MSFSRLIKVSILVIILAGQGLAQVSVAPTALFVDSKSKFATFQVANSSKMAQEVKVAFVFAYPVSADDGDLTYIYDDEEQAALHSAADWIRGMPKYFVLDAGARQTVRLAIKAPGRLAAGTYWARLKVTSTQLSTDVGAASPNAVSTQINFQVNQTFPIYFKHGTTNTGLELVGLEKNFKSPRKIVFVADVKKSGNSPYLGTMHAKIFDATGEMVGESIVLLSIFYDGKRRIEMDISDLPLGAYTSKIEIKSGRSDIMARDIIPGNAVNSSIEFTKL